MFDEASLLYTANLGHMEIHISDWTHKFQNETGLDAKANLELYKSNRVNSVEVQKNQLQRLHYVNVTFSHSDHFSAHAASMVKYNMLGFF